MNTVILSKVDVSIGDSVVAFDVGLHIDETQRRLDMLRLYSPLYYFDGEYNAMRKALLKTLRLNKVKRTDARMNTFVSNGFAERLAEAQRALKRVEEYLPGESMNVKLSAYTRPSDEKWVGISGTDNLIADARVLYRAQQIAVASMSLELELAAVRFNKMKLPSIQYTS